MLVPEEKTYGRQVYVDCKSCTHRWRDPPHHMLWSMLNMSEVKLGGLELGLIWFREDDGSLPA